MGPQMQGVMTKRESGLTGSLEIADFTSPTKTFKFELSSHESRHQNVEHDDAGKFSISRGRTCTGWARSLAGCTALGTDAAGIPGEVVAAGGTAADRRVSSRKQERCPGDRQQ